MYYVIGAMGIVLVRDQYKRTLQWIFNETISARMEKKNLISSDFVLSIQINGKNGKGQNLKLITRHSMQFLKLLKTSSVSAAVGTRSN